MSANACAVALYLERMPPLAWGTLAPECECCKKGRAIALCWFALGFSFLACSLCTEQIATAEIMSAALRRLCK